MSIGHRTFAAGPSERCLSKLAVASDTSDASSSNPQAALGAVRIDIATGKVALILFGRDAKDADALARSIKHGVDNFSVTAVNNVAIGWSKEPDQAEGPYIEGCLRSELTSAQRSAARARAAVRRREAAKEAAEIRAIETRADAEYARLKGDNALMALVPKCTEPLSTLNAETRRGVQTLANDGYPMSLQTFETRVSESIPGSLGRTRCADVMAALIVLIENP